MKIFLLIALLWSMPVQALDIDAPMKSLRERIEVGRQSADLINNLRDAVISSGSSDALAQLEDMARRGNISAVVFLGCVFERGIGGIERNSYRAAQYFHVAAKQGNAYALYNLGLAYLHGRGIPRNIVHAKNLFNMAAKGNVKHAAVNLGMLAEVDKRWDEAVRWYQRASGDRLHDFATLKYGLFMFRGQGITKNHRDGVGLIRKAADTWNPDALLALIEIHLNGLGGLSQNRQEAAKYYEILLRSNRSPDSKVMQSLAVQLQQEDREVVQRSVEIWVAAHPHLQAETQYNLPIWED